MEEHLEELSALPQHLYIQQDWWITSSTSRTEGGGIVSDLLSPQVSKMCLVFLLMYNCSLIGRKASAIGRGTSTLCEVRMAGSDEKLIDADHPMHIRCLILTCNRVVLFVII